MLIILEQFPLHKAEHLFVHQAANPFRVQRINRTAKQEILKLDFSIVCVLSAFFVNSTDILHCSAFYCDQTAILMFAFEHIIVLRIEIVICEYISRFDTNLIAVTVAVVVAATESS